MNERRGGQRAAVVPAVGSAGSLATIRSLGRSGVHVIGVSEDRTPPSFSSRYCSEQLAVPSPREDLDGYRDALLDLAARPTVDAVVPMREADIHVLSKYRSAFGEHLETPWPTFDRLQAVHDRKKLYAAAERAGVAVPATEPLDEIDDWDRHRIVKARHALLTAEAIDGFPDGRIEPPPKTIFLEPGVEPDVDVIVEAMGHVPFAQTYLDGTEYCFRALCKDGKALVTSGKVLHRGYKYARGPSVYHESVDDQELEATGRALLSELEWDGLASVGFITDETGTFQLLEVNPRMPASVPVDIHAGVDYPGHYWNCSRGRTVEPQSDYRPGKASHLLRGEFVHLHSILREEYPLAERPSFPSAVWNLASSMVRQPRFDVLSLDDPGPFVRDALNTAIDLIERARGARLTPYRR